MKHSDATELLVHQITNYSSHANEWQITVFGDYKGEKTTPCYTFLTISKIS